MKKLFFMLMGLAPLPLLANTVFANTSSRPLDIYGINSVLNINSAYKMRDYFTLLQGDFYFSNTLFWGVIAIILALFAHYKLVGPKEFDHSVMMRVYSKIDVCLHWCTAVPMIILIITGFIIICTKLLGYNIGGEWFRLVRKVHMLAAIVCAPFMLIMMLKWLKYALPKLYDISWFLILGGYLSKDKKIIKAGKFNAGQKMWFYIALVGGLVLAFSGYNIYFLEGNINYLRFLIILHSVLGIVVTGFLAVHIYMSVFVVHGMGTMIDGKMPEEEVKYMHNEYYKELKA